MQVKSIRRYVKTTPDKVRILANLVKGKKYPQALSQLEYSNHAAAIPIIQTLKQAKDQAKEKIISDDEVIIKNIIIDEGPKLKRRRIVHQGRATSILKRMSHISVIIEIPDEKEKSKNKILTNTSNKQKQGSK